MSVTPLLAALAASLRAQGISIDEDGVIDAEVSAAIGQPVTVDLIADLMAYAAENSACYLAWVAAADEKERDLHLTTVETVAALGIELNGLNYTEISKVFGISEKDVSDLHKFRGRASFRRAALVLATLLAPHLDRRPAIDDREVRP